MKLDPGIHIVMHLVLFLKPGVTGAHGRGAPARRGRAPGRGGGGAGARQGRRTGGDRRRDAGGHRGAAAVAVRGGGGGAGPRRGRCARARVGVVALSTRGNAR